ncbi:MAG: Mur ligase family protein [Bacteroidia bacterium]
MSVSTDTRQINKGQMFIALRGDNFNGNEFALKAIEQGASYVVVDEGEFSDSRIIKVDDCLLFLQSIARFHRQQMNATILGIGGSNGKTTTKELLMSVLSIDKSIHSTKGNFNNHIGLPLTLLLLRPEHELAIIEMGANKIGDIKELCDIAEPDMGLITNIGKEHLEGFGSIEGVAQAESELFDYLLKRMVSHL